MAFDEQGESLGQVLQLPEEIRFVGKVAAADLADAVADAQVGTGGRACRAPRA